MRHKQYFGGMGLVRCLLSATVTSSYSSFGPSKFIRLQTPVVFNLFSHVHCMPHCLIVCNPFVVVVVVVVVVDVVDVVVVVVGVYFASLDIIIVIRFAMGFAALSLSLSLPLLYLFST